MCLYVPKNFQSPRIFCPKVFSVHEKGWEPQKGGDRKKGGDEKKVGERKKDLDGKKVGDRKKYWDKKKWDGKKDGDKQRWEQTNRLGMNKQSVYKQIEWE